MTEEDAIKILIENKMKPEIMKHFRKLSRTAHRKEKKERFLKENPEIALEMSRKEEQKKLLRTARAAKKPTTEEDKTSREEYLKKIQEDAKAKKEESIKFYIEESGVSNKLYSIITNISIHERETYFIATISYKGTPGYKKHEGSTKDECVSWIIETLKEIEEETIAPDEMELDVF